MDFRLSEDQQMVRDAAREFAATHVAPGAAARDRDEEFPIEPFRKAGEYGFTGVCVPEEFGGAGLGNVELSLVLMEVNRACASTGVTLSVHNSLCIASLLNAGSDEQRRRFLPGLASGEQLGAYSLSEAGSGSDAAALVCGARADGDDFVLSGTKLWVTSATHADVFVIFARTERTERNSDGITCFLVERDTPGFQVSKKEQKLGIRASSTCELVLDDVRVPRANVVGEVGRGFPIAMELLDGGRIGIASQSVGIARACIEASITYAKERHAFGKPIARFGAIRAKLAEMQARTDAAEWMTLRAAWLKDAGEPHGLAASEAKLLASQTANHCARDAVQIHGGAGYLEDFPVERYFRDARITEIYEGTTEIQRLVISRAMLR